MASYGEQELSFDSFRVGRIRVTYVTHSPAIYPRLILGLGVMLTEMPAEPHAPTLTKMPYELREMTGELRLSEQQDVIGLLYWPGFHQHVRSNKTPYENQIQLACDLDHHRIKQIEEHRNGGAPAFWVQLWPILGSAMATFCPQISPFQLQLPREVWLDFYNNVGGGQYDLLEIHYPAREAAYFSRATARLKSARDKILEGEHDEALSLCRKAIEALGHELEPGDPSEAIRHLFVRSLDEKRAAEYYGVVSKVKNLAAFAHHELGKPMTYSRAEAEFVVRTTESILALLGRLADK